jgi:universal stress protein A
MEDVKRILVLSRSTRHCRKAVHYGVSLARKYEAELYVLHVIHDPFSLEGWNLPVHSIEKEYEKAKQEAKKDVDRIVASEQGRGLTIKESIGEGDPVNEVLKVVKAEKIDLLIMLSHEEGHFEHLLFGRTDETLVRKMPCSILLLKEEY